MKRALADVLWEAANVHLWSGDSGASGCDFSCFAVSLACDVLCADMSDGSEHPAWLFMVSLGLRYDSSEVWPAKFFNPLREAELQGVRYMWLLLAMHVAEDEGIEIEVDA